MEINADNLPRLATTALFLCVILFSFVRILIKGDVRQETYKKIIGGLSVFLVAIIADHEFIYFVSFFIGGLLIATERFLSVLAAIFTAEKTDVKDILFRSMTAEEYQQKVVKEALQPVAKTPARGMQRTSKVPQKSPGQLQAIEMEQQVLEYVQSQVEAAGTSNLKLERYVVVSEETGERAYDAIAMHPNRNEILFALEIRSIRVSQTNQFTVRTVEQTMRRMKNDDYAVITAFVLDNYKQSLVSELKKLARRLEKADLHMITLLWSDDRLDVIDDSQLQSVLAG